MERNHQNCACRILPLSWMWRITRGYIKMQKLHTFVLIMLCSPMNAIFCYPISTNPGTRKEKQKSTMSLTNWFWSSRQPSPVCLAALWVIVDYFHGHRWWWPLTESLKVIQYFQQTPHAPGLSRTAVMAHLNTLQGTPYSTFQNKTLAFSYEILSQAFRGHNKPTCRIIIPFMIRSNSV